jgi:hypothetical protein
MGEQLDSTPRYGLLRSRLDPGASASHSKLARTGEFGRWWPDACGGDLLGIRRFCLQLPPSVWERPWEGTYLEKKDHCRE